MSKNHTPLLDDLMDRLNAFYDERRGQKKDLIEELGIPAPMLSAWLKRKKNPSGEYALQIRQWLEDHE